MKKILIIFFTINSFVPILAQNLIPNASFEEFDSNFILPGPYYLNQSFGIYYNWKSINTADFYYTENYWIFNSLSENLFDSLSNNVYIGADSCFLCVPQNNFGFRTTRTGNGYTGIRAYSGAQGHYYKEFLKVQLTDSLIQDRIYQISFYTCPSTKNPYSLSSLGAYITDHEVYSYNNLSAQILAENAIENTSEWTEVKGLYKASGGEDHITIGNFDTETVLNDTFFNVNLSCLYYFIEDVSLFPYSKRIDTTICQGDTIILSPDKQYNSSCLWQNGSTDSLLYVFEEGIYWMKQSYYWPETSTIVNQYDSIQVSFKNLPNLLSNELGNDTNICTGESIMLNATNSNVNYEWSNGSNSNQYTANQSEVIWLKEYNACEQTIDTLILQIIEPLFLDLGPDTVLCSGSSFNINLQGGTILWNDGNTLNNYVINDEGIYSVTLSNQCETIIDSIHINLIQPLTPIDLGSDTNLCFGDSLILNTTNIDANYEWSNGENTNQYLANNDGSIWLREYNQCMSVSDTIEIDIIDQLTLDLGNDTIICFGEEYQINPIINSNAIEYLWSNSATTETLTVNHQGVFWLEISNQCETISDSLNLKLIEQLELELGQDTSICYNDTHILKINNPNVDILWNDNSKEKKYEINDAGLYHVTISNRCESINDSIRISIYPQLNLNLGKDIQLCKDDTLNFVMNVDLYNENTNYLWQDGSQNSSYTYNGLGQYWVEISSTCETLRDSLLIEYFCECELYIPNSFTPNHDNHNDYFFTKQNCSYDSFHLQIFNRWGDLIFETFDPREGWDGKYKNQISPIGVYSYKIDILFDEVHKKINRKFGTLLLAQ